MKYSNYLVIIDNLNQIEKLKSNAFVNYVYPLEFFSVGFNNYFNLNEIVEENSYILINKLLTSIECDDLKQTLKTLPTNIKGVIFDDIAVSVLLENIDVEKIHFYTHFNTNSLSINELNNYSDTVVLSTDITLDEVNNIIDSSTKKTSVYAYGYTPAMYTRRLLNTNYAKHHCIENKNNLEIKNTNFKFLCTENSSGTVVYETPHLNIMPLIKADDYKYVIINLFNISTDDFLNEFKDNVTTNTGFLSKKTIYKVKGEI